jgi:uncharacterized phage-like protein YoqJ
MKSIMVTGHRKVKGQYYNSSNLSKEWKWAREELNKLLTKLRNKYEDIELISGMAISWDTIAAELAQPGELIAAIPFKGQEKMWPQESKELYWRLLYTAKEKHIISEGGYSAYKMQVRNVWMSDRCSCAIALWDGTERGGTWNCIQYLVKIGKPIIVINPNTQKIYRYNKEG